MKLRYLSLLLILTWSIGSVAPAHASQTMTNQSTLEQLTRQVYQLQIALLTYQLAQLQQLRNAAPSLLTTGVTDLTRAESVPVSLLVAGTATERMMASSVEAARELCADRAPDFSGQLVECIFGGELIFTTVFTE